MIDLLIHSTLPNSLIEPFEQQFLHGKATDEILYEQYRSLFEKHQLDDFQVLTWLKLLSDNNCIYSTLLLANYLSPITNKYLAFQSHKLSHEALCIALNELSKDLSSPLHNRIVKCYPDAHWQACKLYLIYCKMFSLDQELKNYCELICDLYSEKFWQKIKKNNPVPF
ncbi:MAG: hypothetical protein HRU40_02940 [Saprospiraceae bacterium]|nr:hypothetical protein [Saprospiraceae bacterium]